MSSPRRFFSCLGVWGFASLAAWALDPPPALEPSTSAPVEAPAAPAPAPASPPASDALGGGTPEESPAKPVETAEENPDKKNPPPLTPDLANLNLAADLELVTLDTQEKVFLPAGTYRQILRIPIDSPAMQTTQKIRRERRPEFKVPEVASDKAGPEKKPFWIRYESLEKIKINEEERRGGLDLPINGPADLKIRLWYAKAETADTASSVFYFVFGGLGYSLANLAGWSAGNTREIPADFEYRLIRR